MKKTSLIFLVIFFLTLTGCSLFGTKKEFNEHRPVVTEPTSIETQLTTNTLLEDKVDYSVFYVTTIQGETEIVTSDSLNTQEINENNSFGNLQ